MIGAADLDDDSARGAPASGYLAGIGCRVYDEARKRGAYLRPLGNTVYVCPPLVIEDRDLESLLSILEASVRAVTSA
jgi:adenosylmethionine-8-amino-7-oxononanoate aminotransferase